MIGSPAHIALGSNLGDRDQHLRSALEQIGRLPGTRLVAASKFFETESVGGPEQPAYLNAAATVRTTLTPRALLDHLLSIEKSRGRTRSAGLRWEARTLDLDLLLYGDLTVGEPGLTIPHPLMHVRRFVLEPLAEIAPLFRIPTLGCTVEQALRGLAASVPGTLR